MIEKLTGKLGDTLSTRRKGTREMMINLFLSALKVGHLCFAAIF